MFQRGFLSDTTQQLAFPRRVAILGCSGSIGRSALEVVAASEGRLKVVMMSVHRRADILVEQIHQMQLRQIADQLKSAEENGNSKKARKNSGSSSGSNSGSNSGSWTGSGLHDDYTQSKQGVQDSHVQDSHLPECVIMTDEWADRTPLKDLPPGIEVLFGQDALCKYVQRQEVDVVLSAIVGSAGFESTASALEAGKVVALANKESLVMGGELITDLAKKNGGKIIPVDSEHSAVLQCLRARGWNGSSNKNANNNGNGNGRNDSLIDNDYLHSDHLHKDLERIILTASGGPFRTLSLQELEKVTVSDALAHPTWSMGKKITVDSATLMNKALELIEARWLFDIPAEKLDAVIHPQSVVHSLVEFVDGSVVAQMSPPDMRLPIQLALTYPQRFESPALKIDWLQRFNLEFIPIDPERFESFGLGLEVARVGGTAGVVLNAANETAVDAFLSERLPFYKITGVVRKILENHDFEQHPTLSRLFELDSWARKETKKVIS